MSSATVLFLCVANSARSQMAEGIARQLAPAGVLVASAGSAPASVHPLAVRAMAEIGIDISGHTSKGVETVQALQLETVITLCGEEVCPVLPGSVRRLHWALPDPAAVEGDNETRLAAFRQVRDELQRRIKQLWSSL